MKHSNTFAIVLLNILFCALLLWFFTRNAFLRPYAGSPFKETLAGLLLLGSLYANYFLFYPMLYLKRTNIVYWLVLVFTVLITGLMDLTIAYNSIVSCNAFIIQEVGFIGFFSMHLFFIAGRNFLLNIFPFLFRERQHFRQALENEVKVVYQDIKMLDVTNKKNNILLVKIEDIFYCRQQGNFTEIFMVQNKKYTRLGSMKHLEQLFGDDFIRITTTKLVPFRYIESCNEDTVIMKKMSWENEPTTFMLEPKNRQEVSERIIECIMRNQEKTSEWDIPKKAARTKTKRKTVTPSNKKLTAILSYIKEHPNCQSGDIVVGTKISMSTVERCIATLKKQRLVKHTGSKKTGGYKAVNNPPEERDEPTTNS